MIGSLMYLVTRTLPDLAFTVSFLSQFSHLFTILPLKGYFATFKVKNERDEETCIIIPMLFIHKRKKGIIYIRFPYMKYRRENILHAINLVKKDNSIETHGCFIQTVVA
jgi:hypothetical protein